MDSGEQSFNELREAGRRQQLEQVGLELRSLMTRERAEESSVG